MPKFKSTYVKRNTIEEKVLRWALEGAKDYWCSKVEAHARDGKVYDKLYKRGAKEIHIINSEEVIEDIIYRLNEMLPDMVDSAIDEKKAKSEQRAGKRVVKKLNKLLGGDK